MSFIIQTFNLTKYYGKYPGIVNLNMQVETGDIFGFIGPNGSGKSTTIRTLLGLISPTSGSCQVFGKDCVNFKNEILSDVGYMPSESAFYNSMTVAEIIKLSAKLHKKDCSKEANVLCERLSLDVKKQAHELSLGNRKKVSIVCALQQKPSLYILDEPTSGLDPLMQREFFSIIKERNEKGATVFLSSHILSDIQRYCTNAAIIKNGTLITSDTVETLSQSSARRVTVTGISSPLSLEGMADVTHHQDTLSFLYNGDINKLIATLNECTIKDISISEPDVEELFMHFYTDDKEAQHDNI